MTRGQIGWIMFAAIWMEGMALAPELRPWPQWAAIGFGTWFLIKAGYLGVRDSYRWRKVSRAGYTARIEAQHQAFLAGDTRTAMFGIYPPVRVFKK